MEKSDLKFNLRKEIGRMIVGGGKCRKGTKCLVLTRYDLPVPERLPFLELRPLFWPSSVALRNSLTALPMELANLGRRVVPKISNTIARTIRSSGTPIPRINPI